MTIFLKSIYYALKDFKDLHSAKVRNEISFAFLVHPRDIKDVLVKYPFLKFFPHKIIEKSLNHFWPVVVSKINGLKNKKGENIYGYIIACPMTAKEMLKDREKAKDFIIKSAILAEKKGAKIIGLGALTASLSRGGIDIQKSVSAQITTGRIFTAKIVTDTTKYVCDKLKLDKEKIEVSVIGAVGSIASASSQIIAKDGFKNINLIDTLERKEKLLAIKDIILKINKNINVKIYTSPSAIKNSDVIITATNKPGLIKSEYLKSGAIIIDDAQPSDVAESIFEKRKDVLILEGGAAHSDNIDANFYFGLQNKGDLYSCLAEVITISQMETAFLTPIGEIKEYDFDKYGLINKEANNIGIRMADLQNHKKKYSKEDLIKVKSIINNR